MIATMLMLKLMYPPITVDRSHFLELSNEYGTSVLNVAMP